MTVRQEVLNVHLAMLLSKLGLRAQAERVKRGRKAPDLTIMHAFLGTMLGEAEIGSSWDDKEVRKKLVNRVLSRFKDPQFNFIDAILLIIYPRELIDKASEVDEYKIENLLAESSIGVGVALRKYDAKIEDFISQKQSIAQKFFPRPVKPLQIPAIIDTLIKDLLGIITSPKDVIDKITSYIETASEYTKINVSDGELIRAWRSVADQLEIDCSILTSAKDCIYLTAKTMFTLIATFLIIYELARGRFPNKLKPLNGKTLTFSKIREALKTLGEINYIEIVDLLTSGLGKLPEDTTLARIMAEIYKLISENIILFKRAGWDALSMIYQKLLSETYRKAYATFYTKLPAARLLAELTVEKPEDMVIDPACGTGSLLIASYYTRQWLSLTPAKIGKKKKKTEGKISILDSISLNLLERTYGLDALNVAVALSSGNLTIASLALPHKRLKIFHVPVGSDKAGSLDLLLARELNIPREELFGKIDVVLMNPPFTRSDRIPNLIGDLARKDLISAKVRFGGEKIENIFVAGLAKPFLALADKLIGENGRIGAVLPNSILSRPAWIDVRKAIARNYTIKYIVTSWAPGTPNFSSDTQFREILLVLKKGSTEEPLKVINLLKSVDDFDEADISLIISFARKRGSSVVLRKTDKKEVIAEIAEIHQEVIRRYFDNFYRLIAYKSKELLEWHTNFIENCSLKLGDLFEIGSVVDHKTGLEVVERSRSMGEQFYDAIWGSGCNVVNKCVIKESPHHIIVVDEKGAKIKFWKDDYRPRYFANLFILRRGQLDTQCVTSFMTEKPCVSNVWWPLKPASKDISTENILSFLIFMNSIFGYTYLLGERLETRGLWLEFKKEHLRNMPIFDFRMVNIEEDSGKLIEMLSSKMPRFRDYISYMANLERKYGSWMESARIALKNQEFGARAKLDLTAYSMVKSLGVGLDPPQKLYTLINSEVEVLRKIMEKSKETGSIKDTGLTRIRKKEAEKIDKWLGEP